VGVRFFDGDVDEVGCESHYHERGTDLVTCFLSIYSLLGHLRIVPLVFLPFLLSVHEMGASCKSLGKGLGLFGQDHQNLQPTFVTPALSLQRRRFA
jgi:hypothetical protein